MRSTHNSKGLALNCCILIFCICNITRVFAETPRSLLPIQTETFKEKHSSKKTRGIIADVPEKTLSNAKDVNRLNKKNGIEINSLKEIDIDSIGTIDTLSGGYPKQMWHGSSRATINSLFKMLPVQLHSRNLQKLYKRLLLTAADVPMQSTKNNETGFLLIRAQSLFNSGYFTDFNDLMEMIPNKYKSEELAILDTDSAFLSNNINKACDITTQWFEISLSKYWQKALIFCDALNSDWDKVDFGLKLLVELGEDDQAFYSLLQNMMTQTEGSLNVQVNNIRPIDVAMIRAARQSLPNPASIIPDPWLLPSYIQDPGTALKTRLLCAENAAKIGVINSVSLSEIYEAVKIDGQEIENALSIALNEATPKARTLLYRATLRHDSSFGKAQAIQRAKSIAIKNKRFSEMAELYGPILKTIPVGSELGWFAADAALIHTANSNLEHTKLWVSLAIREANIDERALQKWNEIWPFLRIMWGDTVFEWSDDSTQKWLKVAKQKSPEIANNLAALMFELMYVLEEPISHQLWTDLVGPNSLSIARKSIFNNQFLIKMAVNQGNLAEAITRLLISLEKTEFDSLPPNELVLIVDSLQKLGFEKEARRLAFEIIVSKSF
ncbi:MAG: hypothetical protein HOJ18_15330 [Rhodospirillaceae bacterium]|nr:hypothetical protein [Rhodospirillaceae bacterium]MBT6307588.1 hypothetical protein [Rhodospirillaceae bacterium]